MEALEAFDLDNIILDAPGASLEWDDGVDVVEQLSNGQVPRVVCRDSPEDVSDGEMLSSHTETQTHRASGTTALRVPWWSRRTAAETKHRRLIAARAEKQNAEETCCQVT